MKKILVIGSINIDQVISVVDLPKDGQTISGLKINYNSGGKGANQAVAIAKMNCNVKMFGAVGNDEWGKFCLSNCNKFKVNTNSVQIIDDQKTGLASIYVQNDGLNSIVVVNGANDYLTKILIDEYSYLIKECDVLVCQLEINTDITFYAMKLAKQLGKITILNPAPAIFLSTQQLKYCDYLIPNETELAICSGYPVQSEKEIEIAIKKILEVAPELEIIATFGERGVFYFNKKTQKIENFKANKVEVVDTTAAGDSFIGGFVSQIIKNISIENAIKFGIKVASITVSRKGSQDAIPFYEEIQNVEK